MPSDVLPGFLFPGVNTGTVRVTCFGGVLRTAGGGSALLAGVCATTSPGGDVPGVPAVASPAPASAVASSVLDLTGVRAVASPVWTKSVLRTGVSASWFAVTRITSPEQKF